jgi:hypothetical protein
MSKSFFDSPESKPSDLNTIVISIVKMEIGIYLK